MNTRFLVALVVGLGSISGVAEGRVWTDSTGRFTIDAELVSLQNDVVQLRKTDGQVVPVPLSRLCAADRQFVDEWKKAKLGSDRGTRKPTATPPPSSEAGAPPAPGTRPGPADSGPSVPGKTPRVGRMMIERALTSRAALSSSRFRCKRLCSPWRTSSRSTSYWTKSLCTTVASILPRLFPPRLPGSRYNRLWKIY